ncbi:hypothetical protein C7974DRAFT_420258 [Boeremia exigua]|uniref:uncharacterized protein n=1 Tax=Boeremia exigua TaxID=749465 RepID=UPI001E8E16EA|nr:uncharacterized protein C7974DRAFT_420258 [Boeremia exigua]KAH6644834.1 hypothetical protein C7974DRAFT_420258 [Boeremia exigua]
MQLTLIAVAIWLCTTARALDINGDTLDQTNRSIRFSRDGTVHAFFDDDSASDDDWQKFTHKGGALMCALNGDDEAAGVLMGDTRTPPSAASPWTGDLKQQLAAWKWTEIDPSSYSCKMDEHWKIPAAMKALGLNGKPQSEGGDNVCHRVEHWDPSLTVDGQRVPAINQWYNVEGTEYQATQAHFEFGVNTAGGALYGFFLESAPHAASALWHAHRRPADPAKLPRLRAFSDILWAYWARANPDVTNIRFFFMLGISNDETNQLIARCLHNAGKELSEWPGVEFGADTEEGHALIGSPNGAAFAYFLLQRKGVLGRKRVERVTVFRAETEDEVMFVDPCLVFHVGDVKVGEERGQSAVSSKL